MIRRRILAGVSPSDRRGAVPVSAQFFSVVTTRRTTRDAVRHGQLQQQLMQLS